MQHVVWGLSQWPLRCSLWPLWQNIWFPLITLASVYFHFSIADLYYLFGQWFDVHRGLVLALNSYHPIFSSQIIIIHVYYFNLSAEDSYVYSLLSTLFWVTDPYILIFIWHLSKEPQPQHNKRLNSISPPFFSKSDHPLIPPCQWVISTSPPLFELKH